MERNKKRNPLKLLVLVVVFLVIGFLVFKVYVGYLKSPVDKNGKMQAFVVAQGESAGDVSAKLKGSGLVRSEWAFKAALKESGKDGKIVPGDYKVSPAMSVEEIVKSLTEGPV